MRNVTDVSAFTDPVTVCQDGDAGAEASFSPTAQALSNRTRNLKNRLDTEVSRVDLQHDSAGHHQNITTNSVAATSNISAGGQVSASQLITSSGLDSLDDFGINIRRGLAAFAPIGSSSVAIGSGGNQDLDITLGHTWQQFLVDVQINAGGISPIVQTIKWAPPSFFFGFAILRVFNIAGSDSTFTLKHGGSGSFTPFRAPNSVDLTWTVKASNATQLLLFMRIIGSAYGSACELISSNVPY